MSLITRNIPPLGPDEKVTTGARKNMTDEDANGVTSCPVDKLDCGTRSQVNATAFGVIPPCKRSLEASRRRVEGGLGSKEVALLRKIFSNGGRDHSGQGAAVSLVALELQGEQEPSPCAARLVIA